MMPFKVSHWYHVHQTICLVTWITVYGYPRALASALTLTVGTETGSQTPIWL